MKIVAKQILTSVIHADERYTNETVKTVVVTDHDFEGLSIETLHDEVFLALREKLRKPTVGY